MYYKFKDQYIKNRMNVNKSINSQKQKQRFVFFAGMRNVKKRQENE